MQIDEIWSFSTSKHQNLGFRKSLQIDWLIGYVECLPSDINKENLDDTDGCLYPYFDTQNVYKRPNKLCVGVRPQWSWTTVFRREREHITGNSSRSMVADKKPTRRGIEFRDASDFQKMRCRPIASRGRDTFLFFRSSRVTRRASSPLSLFSSLSRGMSRTAADSFRKTASFLSARRSTHTATRIHQTR